MTEDQQLARVNGYQGLVAAIRARKEALGISDSDLEEIAGLTRGHVSKILAPGATRVLGPLSMGRLLRSLGIELIVAENPVQTEKIKGLYTPRAEYRVNAKGRMHSVGVHIEVSRKFLREIGGKGGECSRKGMSRRKASALGRRAARARWEKKKQRG